jgi:hypothetical protein
MSNSRTDTGGVVFAGLIILVAVVAFVGWLFMLAIGILHSNFNVPSVTTGYWESVASAFALSVIGGVFTGGVTGARAANR